MVLLQTRRPWIPSSSWFTAMTALFARIDKVALSRFRISHPISKGAFLPEEDARQQAGNGMRWCDCPPFLPINSPPSHGMHESVVSFALMWINHAHDGPQGEVGLVLLIGHATIPDLQPNQHTNTPNPEPPSRAREHRWNPRTMMTSPTTVPAAAAASGPPITHLEHIGVIKMAWSRIPPSPTIDRQDIHHTVPIGGDIRGRPPAVPHTCTHNHRAHPPTHVRVRVTPPSPHASRHL